MMSEVHQQAGGDTSRKSSLYDEDLSQPLRTIYTRMDYRNYITLYSQRNSAQIRHLTSSVSLLLALRQQPLSAHLLPSKQVSRLE